MYERLLSLARERGRVLIVDRTPARRRAIREALERLGCTCHEASTPLEAVQLLEWGRAVVGGVVIGPTLTQTEAPELAAFLRAAYPSHEVVTLPAEETWMPVAADRVTPARMPEA